MKRLLETARRWHRYAAIAIIAHLAVLAALVLAWERLTRMETAQPPFIAAQLLPPPASPVALPPVSLSAAPADVKPPRPLPRPQAPPKPRKADGVLAAVATAHDPNARTPPDPEAIAPPAEVADAAPASATVVVSSPVAGFDGATIENAQSRWEAEVLAHLDRLKRYPAAALLRGQQDTVSVRVRIARDGDVLAQDITASQAYPSLDREALALIARASPLPAPPPELRTADLDFILPIEFHIDRTQISIW